MANAKETLMLQLAQKGIVGAQAETTIEKIVAAIPEGVRSTYPTDREEAALAFMSTYFSSYNGTEAPVSPTEVQAPIAGASKPSALTAEQSAKIAKAVNANLAIADVISKKTIIKKIIVDKPLPQDYIPEGTMVVPFLKDEKIAEYEKKLIQDEENIAAFQEIKAAIKNKTPMAAFRDGKNYKTVGYEIETPKAENTENMETQILSTKGLLGFLATKANAVIYPNGDLQMSAVLKYTTPKKSAGGKATVATSTGTPRAVVKNRAAAMAGAEGSTWDIASVKDAAADAKTGKLRIAKVFKINTGKTNQSGEPIVRTVRVSGDYADMPTWVRKAEYAAALPLGSKDFVPPQGAELQAAMKAKQQLLETVWQKGGAAAIEYGVQDVIEKLGQDLLAVSDDVANVNL